MRKFIWWSAIFCSAIIFNSCADDLDAQEIQPVQVETRNSKNAIILTDSQQSALNYLYNYCVENFYEQIANAAYIFNQPTNDEKIAVVRFIDYCIDGNGDYLCEIPAYDEIREILWPKGFGKF